MKGRDHGALQDAEPLERRTELVQPRRELEIDVQPDVRRLLDEERERVVERR
jgi:hypothetical protein